MVAWLIYLIYLFIFFYFYYQSPLFNHLLYYIIYLFILIVINHFYLFSYFIIYLFICLVSFYLFIYYYFIILWFIYFYSFIQFNNLKFFFIEKSTNGEVFGKGRTLYMICMDSFLKFNKKFSSGWDKIQREGRSPKVWRLPMAIKKHRLVVLWAYWRLFSEEEV